MIVRFEKTLTGDWVGFVDGVPVVKGRTEAAVRTNFDYLKNLPAHMFAAAIKVN